jgi:hypothetical protein
MHHLNLCFTDTPNKWGPGYITFRGIGNYESGSIVNIDFDISSGPPSNFIGWFDDAHGINPSTSTISGSTEKNNAVAIFNGDITLYCYLTP